MLYIIVFLFYNKTYVINSRVVLLGTKTPLMTDKLDKYTSWLLFYNKQRDTSEDELEWIERDWVHF